MAVSIHLIAVICLFFFLSLGISKKRLDISPVLPSLIIALALLYWGVSLWTGGDVTCLRHTVHRTSETLMVALGVEDQDKRYPAGWAADLPFVKEYRPQQFRGSRLVPHPCWHTWLTGFSPLEKIQGEAWYPGGILGNVINKIEIRER